MLHRFALAELSASPWKNGGGATREIACWPPGAGFEDFEWRASVATIGSSGPFSRFAGVDRTIMLLEGDGVALRGEGVAHRLDAPLAPFEFSGDVALECALLGGESTDFNLMTRRGRLTASLRVLTAGAELDPAPHGLLLAWRGDWRVAGELLEQGQGLWWADAPASWRVSAQSDGAALIAAQWRQENK